jgi:hypothetical protein
MVGPRESLCQPDLARHVALASRRPAPFSRGEITESPKAGLWRRRHESIAEVGLWQNRVVQGYFDCHAVPSSLRRVEGSRSRFAAHDGTRCSGGASGTGCPGSASIGSPAATYRTVASSIPIRRSGFMRHDLRQEPYAVTLHVRICAGGGGQPPSLPRPRNGKNAAQTHLLTPNHGPPPRRACLRVRMRAGAEFDHIMA